MHKHPDADSFVLAHLREPANATTRLAFADWLDETGTPSNVAWASYIRLREEAERRAGGPRRELIRAADEHAPKVRARLELAARVFARDPESVLQIIPAANLSIRLGSFTPQRGVLELVPESVVRENRVLPLAARGQTLYCAATEPNNPDTAEKLTFILNRELNFVGADRTDLLGAVNRAFGQTEEAFDSVFREYAYAPLLPGDPPDLSWHAEPDTSAVRFVNLLIREAIDRKVEQIHITPEPTGMEITYLANVWLQHGWVPPRLQAGVLVRLAHMAEIPIEWTLARPPFDGPITGSFTIGFTDARFQVRVTMHPSARGPTTLIALTEVPA